MEVGHDKTPADDHNTNQNEATVSCKPIFDVDGSIPGHVELAQFEAKENELTASDRPDSPHNEDAGMCHVVPTMIIQNSKSNSSEQTFVISQPESSCCQNSGFEDGDESLSATGGDGTGDESMKIPLDSHCTNLPSDKELDNANNRSNMKSAVDLSVTSDEDVKVTCRCSSTPVNHSIHKTLNDTDCSMSSVGDASPIQTTDNDSKMLNSHQSCDVSSVNDSLDGPGSDSDKIENGNMYLQPQTCPKPADSRGQPTDGEHTPRCPPYYMDRKQTPGYPQSYPNHLIRPYPASPYEYPQFLDGVCGYNDYQLCGQRSMTDMKNRHDVQMNINAQSDLCCYPTHPAGVSDRDCFVYPSIYVSNAGLISVLLRNDMSVEMTVDRTIRVVSHNHMMAVATDSKGTAASLYHPAVKIFQMGYNTDIATDAFRAKMSQGEAIFFSNGANCFKLQESELQPLAPIKFSDIHRDQSVNLLFSSEGYGESLVATCMQVAAQAEYANLPKGGVIVRINGVKVTQSGCGDVTVVTGAKFIRLSPHNGTTRLGNRFVDIEVERDWSVKLTRGTHSFIATKKRTMVSNGKMEAGFDENNGLKVINLQSRHPLLAEPSISRRPGKRMIRTPPNNTSTYFTPRRRIPTPNNGRGGVNTC